MRWIEVALFAAPLLLVAVWATAVARGLDAPPPRHLAVAAAVVAGLGFALAGMALREHLPTGRYVPAHLEGTRVVPGHAE